MLLEANGFNHVFCYQLEMMWVQGYA